MTEIEEYCLHKKDRLRALLGEDKFASFEQKLCETDDIVKFLNNCETYICNLDPTNK